MRNDPTDQIAAEAKDEACNVSPPGVNARVPRSPASGRINWIIALSLVVIATCLVLRLDERARGLVQAQPIAGARGIFAFPGQFSKNSYGIFMVDVDTATVWCYEYLAAKRQLRLVAGRSWKYDRYLEEFNADEPPLPEIEQMVEAQRARKLQSSGAGVP